MMDKHTEPHFIVRIEVEAAHETPGVVSIQIHSKLQRPASEHESHTVEDLLGYREIPSALFLLKADSVPDLCLDLMRAARDSHS